MTLNRTTCRQRHRSTGLTLVEILVTIIILAIGLLGLATLQLNALRNNTTAYERTQAGNMAYSMIDRMRSNKGAAANYAVAMGSGPASSVTDCQGSSADCSTADMATYDVAAWECSLGSKWSTGSATTSASGCKDIGAISPGPLANGDGSITVTNTTDGTVVTVTVQWTEKRGQTNAAASPTSLSVSTIL